MTLRVAEYASEIHPHSVLPSPSNAEVPSVELAVSKTPAELPREMSPAPVFEYFGMDVAVPSSKDIEPTIAALHQLHNTSEHGSNRNLAQLMRDAKKPEWVVELAANLHCDACEANRSGALLIPNAATFEIPTPWSFVGVDMGELKCPRFDCKVKFMLCMDLATKLTRVIIAKRYNLKEQKHESAEDVIRLFPEAWLTEKPRPHESSLTPPLRSPRKASPNSLKRT